MTNHHFKISRFSAKFVDPKLEAQYQAYSRLNKISVHRGILYLALVIFGLYGFLDSIILTDARDLAIKLRGLFCLVGMAIIGLTYLDFGKRNFQQLVVTYMLLGAGMICIVINQENNEKLPYYMGLIQICVVFSVLMNVSFFKATMCMLTIGFLYVSAVIGMPQGPEIIASYFFIGSSFLLLGIGTYFIENARRQEYIQHNTKERLTHRLKAMIDDATETLHRKTAIMNILTHVFNTPLHQIIGYSQILESEMLGELGHPDYKKYNSSIHEAGTALLKQIKRLMLYSRLDSGALNSHKKDVWLEELIDLALPHIRSTDQQPPYNVDLEVDNIKLHVDPTQVSQALEELLNNALQHTPKEEPISIKNKITEDHVIIIIENKGQSLSETQLESIYNPLDKTEDFMNMGGQSAGIGIGIAHRIAQLNDGKVLVENGPSSGVIAQLILPRISPNATTVDMSSSRQAYGAQIAS